MAIKDMVDNLERLKDKEDEDICGQSSERLNAYSHRRLSYEL